MNLVCITFCPTPQLVESRSCNSLSRNIRYQVLVSKAFSLGGVSPKISFVIQAFHFLESTLFVSRSLLLLQFPSGCCAATCVFFSVFLISFREEFALLSPGHSL